MRHETSHRHVKLDVDDEVDRSLEQE